MSIADFTRFRVRGPSWVRQVPRAPLPRDWCYRHGGDVLRLLGRPYPSFIAPMSSCAKPLPSVRLWSPSYVRSLQVATSPCCAKALPDSISANLSRRAWTPTPAASSVHLLDSSARALAFPSVQVGRRLATFPTAISVGGAYFGAVVISFCSGPSVCSPHRWLPPLHPSMPSGRGFYARAYYGWLPAPYCGYANRPIRAIDGKGTCTPPDWQPCRLLLYASHPPVARRMATLATGLPATALTGLDLHQLDSDKEFH
jgi:hypothetical protein